MKQFGIKITNVRVKDGKLEKIPPRMDVSRKIAQAKSKKVKPVRRTAG